MDFFAIVIALIVVAVSGISKAGKTKKATPAQPSRRPRTVKASYDAGDHFQAFLDAVSEAKIPDKILSEIPIFGKTQPEPVPSQPVYKKDEGEPCDVPHSNDDPRLGEEARPVAPAPDPVRAPAPRRFAAGDMRRAVITSEILSPPVSLRKRRSI